MNVKLFVDAQVVIGLSTMQHIMWLAKRDVNLGVVDDDEYVKSGRSKKHGKVCLKLISFFLLREYYSYVTILTF
jgi:hypothetical protein